MIKPIVNNNEDKYGFERLLQDDSIEHGRLESVMERLPDP